MVKVWTDLHEHKSDRLIKQCLHRKSKYSHFNSRAQSRKKHCLVSLTTMAQIHKGGLDLIHGLNPHLHNTRFKN